LNPDRTQLNDGQYLLIALDWRVSDTAGFLLRELQAWRDYATVEVIDDDHCALILRPGLAKWIAARGLTNKKGTVR